MKKNILMIAYTKYSCDSRVRREAETLVSHQDFEVTFIVPKEGDLPRNYRMDGVNVVELDIKQYQGKSKKSYMLSYLKYLVLAFISCTRLFFARKVDVVHVHNMPDFLVYAAMIPRLFGKKVILDVHDSVPETYATKFGRESNVLFKLFCWEEALSCWFAHKIICVNHTQMDLLVERGIPAQKMTISMNVPDHKRFSLKDYDNDIVKSSTNFNLVYHGTIVKRLGIDLTIQAVAKLKDKIPGLKFYVFGDGDDRNEFIELSKSLGVDKYVHFRKFVPIESLPSTLENMHLGVVSNRKSIATEIMLPVKMLEYVALNIPVVAPRLRTIQYYFSEDMVCYFDPESIDDLARAILELYNDESKRTAQVQMAREFINKYGWENHQMDLINLYKKL